MLKIAAQAPGASRGPKPPAALQRRRTVTGSTVPNTPAISTPRGATPAFPFSGTGGFGAEIPMRSEVPAMVSEEEIQALLAAPPLPYAAARVGPPGAGAPPQRLFCDTCGYWGRVKCLKCGARVCGLECKGKHDQSMCTRF
jgi:zinc finger HIT domain-containing protein 1